MTSCLARKRASLAEANGQKRCNLKWDLEAAFKAEGRSGPSTATENNPRSGRVRAERYSAARIDNFNPAVK
jgi:hypothetical protein